MVTIDQEFKSLIPPLADNERAALEENILKDGCRDPLVIWGGTLVDGHNRYEICTAYDLPYKTINMEFVDRDDAMDWIDRNQIGRRNLKPDVFKLVLGRIYNREKKSVGQHKGNQHTMEKDQIDPIPTADRIAADHGVSPATVKRAGKLADAEAEVRKEASEPTPEIEKPATLSQDDVIAEAKRRIKAEEEDKSIKKKEEKRKQIEKRKEEYKKQDASNNSAKVRLCDCFDFLNEIKGNSIDLLLTDPPYSTDVDDIDSFAKSWLPLALSKLKRTGRAYVFIGAYPAEIVAYMSVCVNSGWIIDNPLIWSYKNTLGQTPKNKYNLNYQMCLHLYSENSFPLDTSVTSEMFSVMEINAPDGRLGDRMHTWQKPIEIAKRFVNHAAQPKGGKMIDPFCCTGTFLIAASKYGMDAVGCDNNKSNLDIAKERGCDMAK